MGPPPLDARHPSTHGTLGSKVAKHVTAAIGWCASSRPRPLPCTSHQPQALLASVSALWVAAWTGRCGGLQVGGRLRRMLNCVRGLAGGRPNVYAHKGRDANRLRVGGRLRTG